MQVGCYTLDLYCDKNKVCTKEFKYNEFPHQYTGPTKKNCVVQARKDGWIFHHNYEASCPKCSK